MAEHDITLGEWSKQHRPLKAGRGSRLLNVSEAAEQLGISRQAVHKAIRSGNLHGHRIVQDHNRKQLVAIVVTAESVENYLMARALRARDKV